MERVQCPGCGTTYRREEINGLPDYFDLLCEKCKSEVLIAEMKLKDYCEKDKPPLPEPPPMPDGVFIKE